MCPDDGAIKDQVFHIRVIGKMLVHLLPNTVVAPAGKAFVDAIPVPVLLGQQAPLGTTPGDPEDTFDKTTALTFLTNVSAWTGS